jgi:UDP-N-acetyl-D-glucosamine dehydrogenase
VVGFEVSEARVEALRNGESYVGDVSDDELRARSPPATCPPPTPPTSPGSTWRSSACRPRCRRWPDLTYIEQAGATLAEHLTEGACVILESTTYPGHHQRAAGPILEEARACRRPVRARLLARAHRPGQHHVHAGEHPEGGERGRRASLAAVDGFFSALVDTTVPVGSPAEAELVKLLENTFRHVNIALVNELAMFARELGSTCGAPSTPRPPSRSATCGSPPARAWAALPADRPELPGVAGQAAPRPHVPVRRAGQRRQRAHARLRAHPGDAMLNEQRAA